MASAETTAMTPSAPLALLLRVNAVQAWRRLMSIRQQSALLTSVIGLFVIGYISLSFWLFYRGLYFVSRFPGLGGVLVERLLYLLFAFLFMMLMFSNLVISYSNLFRNRETMFLLSLPLTPQTIFRWKFVESSLVASWAFLFLVSPLLAAFGLSRHAPWHFYPLTVGLVALFIVLPTVFGSWFAIMLARFMDRRSFQIAAVGGAIVLITAVAIFMKPEDVPKDLIDTRVLGLMDRLLTRTNFATFPLLPSYWLSSSVLQWLEGATAAAAFFVLVLLSYVLFFGFISFTRTGGHFYDAISMVQSRGSLFGHWEWFAKRRGMPSRFAYPRGLAEIVLGWFRFLSVDTRALVVKDIRMFWRDTTQWGQTLMLFGLLGVYILNLRHFSQQMVSPFWVHLISFLNLGACSLNLATLTTRFVYPQFSLEGKRLWIVGMAPLGLARLVRVKFWMTTLGSWVLTFSLILLSCRMLQMSWWRTAYFGCAVTIMTFTMNGLAVGLGVLYPNFKEENPSKIVGGFGGTFCLVLSFLYIVFSVVLLAVTSPWTHQQLYGSGLTTMVEGWLGFLAISLTLGWMPMRLARHRVVTIEI